MTLKTLTLIESDVAPDANVTLDGIQWKTWTDEYGTLRYAACDDVKTPAEDLDWLVKTQIQYELDQIASIA